MSDIWMQSRFGRRVDMLDPHPAEINWWELCDTLARIQRYNGCAEPGVSVAYHSLLVHELSDPDVRPYALIHDFHEGIIGDITTPTAQAIAELAEEAGADIGLNPEIAEQMDEVVRRAIRKLKHRHDKAIWAAAGLEPPTFRQAALIREADIRALVTEVRDFMRAPPAPWGEPYASAKPLPVLLRGDEYGFTPYQIACSLFNALTDVLPARTASTATLHEAA